MNDDWTTRVLRLLQEVADHWKDTDAPIGVEAVRLLDEFDGHEAEMPTR